MARIYNRKTRDPKARDAERILVAVRSVFDVSMAFLKGERRLAPIVRARFAAAILLRERLGYSYPSIGMVLGGKDHTTAINACRRARELLDVDVEFRDRVQLALRLVAADVAYQRHNAGKTQGDRTIELLVSMGLRPSQPAQVEARDPIDWAYEPSQPESVDGLLFSTTPEIS